jgi:two-component system, OmpR family, phosphate regulon response regulator PhoB
MSTATQPNILIVEDEPAVAALVTATLRMAGYEVVVAQNAEQAMRAINGQAFDAAIVDWMLPNTTGVELIITLRQQPKNRLLPILMLTANALENQKIIGLEAGADDYLTKPFSPRELTARIKALLRRSQPLRDEALLSVGPITLLPTQGKVVFQSADNHSVAVTVSHTEFKLLQCLMLHPQRVHSRDSLLAQAWDHAAQVDSRTIDAHIKRLRQALASAGCAEYIHTVRGMGYTLDAAL